MVKEPEHKLQFRLLKEQIHFWEKSIDTSKELLAHDRAALKVSKALLKKLEKRYSE